MPFPLAIPLITAGVSALGSMLGANAQNKGAKQSYEIDLKRLLLDRDSQAFNQGILRQQEGREGASDAWRKLLATNYAQNRGPRPSLSPYSVPQRSLAGLQPGADALMQEVMARLQGGNPIAPVTPTDLNPPRPPLTIFGRQLGRQV